MAAFSGDVVVAIVIFSIGSILVALGIWERLVRWRAKDWPATMASIDAVSISGPSGKGNKWQSRLDYAFTVLEKRYTGRYSQTFSFEEDAQEWIRDLRGKTVSVHYWPGWPALSVVEKNDIDELLRSRLPLPPDPVPGQASFQQMSPVKVILAYPLMIVAVLGFGLSFYVHVASIVGKAVLPESWFFPMHAAMFVPFFGALLLLPKKTARKKDSFAIPGSLGTLMIAILIYALGNFAWFMTYVATHGNSAPLIVQWRGFSGHWMLFHFWSFAFLYSVVRGRRKTAAPNCRVPNIH